MEYLSGIVLKGRYCILEALGKGGGGKVYLARDLELGVLWAVKEVSASGRNEARMLLKLSHPSLPKMIDYIEDDGKCFLIMEYIKGKSFGEYLRIGKSFSIKEIVKYGTEIADVLSYLHKRKPPVYYGDLKPDNLMLGENGRVYLVDLGGAVNGYKYEHKLCTGTAGYAAPEQYEGKINAATDVYAFGKTLLALCGKADILLFIRNLSLFWLIFRCCLKKPEIRYQNMQIVEKKLERLQKRQNQSKIKNILVISGSSIVFAAITIFLLFGSDINSDISSDLVSDSKTFDFYEELTAVTEIYYQEEFQNGSKAEKKEICKQADVRLRELQKQCTEKEESRKILQLLAVNSEYQEDYEDAGLYYEQMLLYDETYRAGYGEYGMFLFRTGQQETGQMLWAEYNSKETMLDNTVSRNLRLWEKEMDKIEKKS